MPILFIVILLSSMGFGLVLPPFLYVAENMGASPAIATTIVATFAIGQFIAIPFWGRLSDKHGRKPILLLTMVGLTVAYLAMALADNLWTLLISRFMTGLMSGNFAVSMAYVSDITKPEKRAQSMGMVGGAISIGFMIGPVIGGLVGGEDAASANLYLPSLVAMGLCALTFLAILFALKESLPAAKRAQHAEDHPHKMNQMQAFRHVLSNPRMAQMVFVGFLVAFSMAMFQTIFPLWSTARFGWGPQEVGFAFTYVAGVVAVCQMVFVGFLAKKLREGQILLLAIVSYFCGLIVMSQAPLVGVMLFGITFTAIGEPLFNTTSNSWVSKQAGEHERGTVLGVYQSLGWVGRGIGPTFSGLFFQTLGPNAPLYLGALLMIPCFFLVQWIRRTSHAAEANSSDQ